jgi:hypothetical protein
MLGLKSDPYYKNLDFRLNLLNLKIYL